MNYFTLCSRVYISTSVILLILGKGLSKSTSYSCGFSKYRSINGTCNNVLHPEWGQTNSTYVRLLPPLSNTAKLPSVDVVSKSLATLKVSGAQKFSLSGIFKFWSSLLKLDLDQSNGENNWLNEATSYLDASFLYNSALQLENGKIAVQFCKRCEAYSNLEKSILLVLTNEHNRLATLLSERNENLDSLTIFEESRRILIAEIQHITYNEYLPLLLGKKQGSQNDALATVYNDQLNPGIYIEVANTLLKLLAGSKNITNETINNADDLNKLIANLMLTNVPNPLVNFQDDMIKQLLFASRSHGIPLYGEFFKFCNDESTNSGPLSSQLNDNQNYIKFIYNESENADLLIGGLLEFRNGGILGMTFSCLLNKQFQLLKESDRFWFETQQSDVAFTPEQLSEIQQVSISSMLCANINDLSFIQNNAFLSYDNLFNPLVSCSFELPLTLESWGEHSIPSRVLVQNKIIQDAIRKAEDDVSRRKQTEYLLWSNKGGVDPKSPIGTAAAFSKANKNALLLANNSILFEYASNELIKFVNSSHKRAKRQFFADDNILTFSDDFGNDFLQDLDVSSLLPDLSTNAASECPTEVGSCDPMYPYRSYTGYCNNLRRPNYGKGLTTFSRLLPPAYDNGISKPRTRSVMGINLPSARLVSSMLHTDISHLDNKHGLMLMQFAQFLDHDITFTPVHRGFFASIPDCRPCDSPLTVHPECMPIEIPAGDPFYPQVNVTSGQRFCLPFMRSLPGQQRLGSRDQLNQNSAFLDASQVYGEHSCLARQLRSYQGRLNATSSTFGDRDLLPQSTSHPECKSKSGYCFIAGDGRASEQPGLTSIHTIFMREHNRLADGLHRVNVHWDDERLYQEARRILIGQYQHIVYNEFLPRILGTTGMHLYSLGLRSNDYFKDYSEDCNPGALAEFATAAFRIGHSLLRPHIPRMSTTYYPLEPAVLLRDSFFNPDIIYQRHMVDEISRGLYSTPMETLDQFVTKEITNHLFEDKRVPHSGMDLIALNIQRARDHGIPSYNEYRAMCNLKRATTWDDFSRELTFEVINRFKRVYPTVDDVDLFSGGMSERPLPGGMVGPTFACIIGIQFRQLRKCDRFWYETADPLLKFTEEQVAEIRKATLAKILCDNFDTPTLIQKAVFDLPSDINPRVSCLSLPFINLNAWRDTDKRCHVGSRTMAVGESLLPSPCTSCVCTSHGARCATIRVTDCVKLIQEVGQEGVLKDEICSAQCSSYITINNSGISDQSSASGRGLNLFPAGGLRPPPPIRKRPMTRSFRLKDFAILLG